VGVYPVLEDQEDIFDEFSDLLWLEIQIDLSGVSFFAQRLRTALRSNRSLLLKRLCILSESVGVLNGGWGMWSVDVGDGDSPVR
jgi:hypothetical protein